MERTPLTVGTMVKDTKKKRYMLVTEILRKRIDGSGVIAPIGFIARSGIQKSFEEQAAECRFSISESQYQVLTAAQRTAAIAETVRQTHEVTLTSFREYDSVEALIQAEGENLSEDALSDDIEEDPNVFRAFGLWLFSDDWHDVDWD